jgi:hypothetical protein
MPSLLRTIRFESMFYVLFHSVSRSITAVAGSSGIALVIFQWHLERTIAAALVRAARSRGEENWRH